MRTVYSSAVNHSVKVLNRMVEDGIVLDNMPVGYFIDAVKPYLRNKHIGFCFERSHMENRYFVLNPRLGVPMLTDAERLRMGSSIVDLYDENELERMNQQLADMSGEPNILNLENLNMSEGIIYG